MPSATSLANLRPGKGRASSQDRLSQACGCPYGQPHDCDEFPLSVASLQYLAAFDAYLSDREGKVTVTLGSERVYGSASAVFSEAGVRLLGTLHPRHPAYRPR